MCWVVGAEEDVGEEDVGEAEAESNAVVAAVVVKAMSPCAPWELDHDVVVRC